MHRVFGDDWWSLPADAMEPNPNWAYLCRIIDDGAAGPGPAIPKAAEQHQLRPVLQRGMELRLPRIPGHQPATLASIFKTAVLDGLITKNPTASLDKPTAVKRVVDPYTRAEAEAIIEHLYATSQKYAQIYAAFFEFSFFTGLRPGEAVGLQWRDINLEERTATIQRIIVDRQPAGRTKTKYHRVVLLNDRALNAIRQARRLAELRRMVSESAYPTSPFVFQPSKGGLWINEPSVTICPFKSAPMALDIRERRQ
jgi:integrase